MLRKLLLVLSFAASLALHAATPTVDARSPLRPGLWWDATRPGSGFDIHVAPGQLFVVWYTYRADGSAIWYTAQGPMGADGTLAASLLQHRWQYGRYGGSLAVGTLTLQRIHGEALAARWRIGADFGESQLNPLLLPGNLPEVDHTGTWFDPARAGFGLGLSERGDWLAAALYAYDAMGEPTWWFGNNEGSGSTLTLGRYRGSCPACAWSPARADGSVRATLAFGGEAALRLDLVDTGALLAPEWRLRDQPLSLVTTPSSRRGADRQLARFADAAAAEAWLRAALASGVYAFNGNLADFSPMPAGADVSQTNLVESGVDEGDVVKSDGRTVYTFATDANGQPQRRLRIAALRADGSGLDPLPDLPLAAGGSGEPPGLASLYLTDTQLVALTGSSAQWLQLGAFSIAPPNSWADGSFDLEVYDRSSDPGRPLLRWHARFDGVLVSTRRIGDTLYLVHRWAPQVSGLRNGGWNGVAGADLRHNQDLVAALDSRTLWPSWRVGAAAAQPLLDPASLLLPPQVTRAPTPEFTLVTAVDLARLERRETLAMVGAVEAVYASSRNLYLATSRYQPVIDYSLGLQWAAGTSVDVHRIALGAGPLVADASGAVEGYLDRDPERAPFRFSEYDGRLRVVTVGEFGNRGRNRLSVLEPSTVAPGTLRTLATLPNKARPEPLGKPHEQLYGTRFAGDRLYAVTFLGIDPLYVVDLAKADDPRIAGALVLPGFSEYLHPLAGNLLLGFGKQTLPATGPGDGRFAWYQGLKLSLFDVADPAQPRVLQEVEIGRRGSESPLLYDHHALSELAPVGAAPRLAFPVRVHEADGSEPADPDPSFHYPWSYTGLASFELAGSGAATRLAPRPTLVVARRGTAIDGSPGTWPAQARSVLLANGIVYVDGGNFWYAPWATPDRPLGPL